MTALNSKVLSGRNRNHLKLGAQAYYFPEAAVTQYHKLVA